MPRRFQNLEELNRALDQRANTTEFDPFFDPDCEKLPRRRGDDEEEASEDPDASPDLEGPTRRRRRKP